MLNFDADRFVRIQSGALSIADPLHSLISERLDAGCDNLFFAGAGGVQLLTRPALRLLKTKSKFPVYYEMGAELVETGSVHLNSRSIVVMPSLSGTTAEAVATLEYVKKQGATVVSLTGHEDTPIAQNADFNFTNFAEDDTSSEMFYLQSLLVALSIMERSGELTDFDVTVDELQRLPELLVEVKRAFEDRAAEFAEENKNEEYHIITGAGSTWPQAYYYGMCILEEMQWIRTRPVHASDFFHGTLELVEDGVSVMVFAGEDECRPLTDRVERFARRFTNKVQVFDAADFALPGISQNTRSLISPVLLATALERVSTHLAERRNHPLTTRRYYKKLEY